MGVLLGAIYRAGREQGGWKVKGEWWPSVELHKIYGFMKGR
jgi:hypothetical protein